MTPADEMLAVLRYSAARIEAQIAAGEAPFNWPTASARLAAMRATMRKLDALTGHDFPLDYQMRIHQ